MHNTEVFQLLQGDCRQMLASLPDASVQCCITSPPYYGLRDYQTGTWQGGDAGCDHIDNVAEAERQRNRKGLACNATEIDGALRSENVQNEIDKICDKCGARRIDSQLGLEQTPDEYVVNMVGVFREVWRVLRDDGTLWLNLGDSYAGSGPSGASYQSETTKRREGMDTDGAFRISKTLGQRGLTYAEKKPIPPPGLKPKDLVGIPWRVAFALQADGWYLRQDIVWSKPNPMPESVTDRCTKSHEYIFLMTKSAKYYYDNQAIMEPAAYAGGKDTVFKGSDKYANGFVPNTSAKTIAVMGHERWPNSLHTGKTGEKHSGYKNPDGSLRTNVKDGVPARNKRSVWVCTTKPYKGAHFATFPPDLITPCVLAGTSEKGCCEKCGSPWERVVEKKTNTAQRNLAGKNNDSYQRGRVTSRSSEHGDFHDLGTVSVKFLGWRATCKCEGEQPVPCVVLDPFSGAGTTGVVAIKNGRHYIGTELNPDYVEMSRKRIQAEWDGITLPMFV